MKHMFRTLSVLFLVCIFAMPVFAQEQVVDNFTINFGIISWEQIQKGMTEKPASHTEEYHYRMAREMATMHGGGGKGTHHILVVLADKKTGRRVSTADVRVKVIDRLRRQKEETVRLQPMTMDGFPGFGEFVEIGFSGAYIFKVSFRLSEKENFKEVEFVKEFAE